MKKKENFRKLTVICLMLICLCGLSTGCSGKKDENGSMKAEDGRSYGGLIKAKQGEKVSTAFFDVTIDSAERYDTYQFEDGLYQADAGNTYLVVTLTIQNTYEKELPMSITDFTLDFEGNKEEGIITGYGKSDLNQDNFMENIFTLKKGESITKSILYTVADKEQYELCYSEYYEDKFEGDSYEISLKPEVKSATTETAVQPDSAEESTDVPTAEGSSSEVSTEIPSADASPTEASTEQQVTETPQQ